MSRFESNLSFLVPTPGQIKVYVGSLESHLNPTLARFLSSEELAHASLFHFEADRIGYQAQRGLWRLGASAITGIEPGEIIIEQDEFGRPFSREVQGSNCDINVSRTKNACALVVSKNQRCGIDVEHVDPSIPDRKLVAMLTSSKSRIDEMTQDCGLFYQTWTQIESVLKADGRGLADGIRRAEYVDSISDVRTQWRIDSKTWLTESISTPSDVVGTVAFERVVTRVMQISEGDIEDALTTRILCALRD